MYRITMIIEDENDDVIFKGETSAGLNDFEENIMRKAEHVIVKHEAEIEYEKMSETGAEY